MTDLRAPATPRRQRVRLLAGALVAAAAGLAYVGVRDPRDPGAPMPVCPFHRATGLDCPGCGGLRMTHDLLHGRLGAAWHDNAVLLVLLPVLAVLLTRFALRWAVGAFATAGQARRDRHATAALAVVAIAWTVVRNLA
ncbi:DUF2752 domain-containing protein [Jatrophihabitans fulvus]